MVRDLSEIGPIIPTERVTSAKGQRKTAGATDASQPTQHPPAQVSSAATEVSQGDLEKAIARVREVFIKVEPQMKIEIDSDLKRVVVKIVNPNSGEIIRQIPAQEMLEIAKRLEQTQGLLLKQQA